MNFAFLLILAFSMIPLSDSSDSDKDSDPVVVVTMEVSLEVVSGIQFLNSFSNAVEVSSSDQKYQVGLREFTISHPAATEIIAGTVSHNHDHGQQHSNICSLYFVTDIEKVDENTGVLRLHYLSSDRQNDKERETGDKHVATIIYL